MQTFVLTGIARLRRKRWAWRLIIVLRIFLGFGLLPAGLKKVLNQPFTDPTNAGPFHDFLHAFYDTGLFYQFVGVVQLTAAFLLLTQYKALLGAIIGIPVMTAITAFCWSTSVYPTATVATLMLCGLFVLSLWDFERWQTLVFADTSLPPPKPSVTSPPPGVSLARWSLCGGTIIVIYAIGCVLQGGIFRPKGLDLDQPAFYIFPAIASLPIAALIADLQATRKLAVSTPQRE